MKLAGVGDNVADVLDLVEQQRGTRGRHRARLQPSVRLRRGEHRRRQRDDLRTRDAAYHQGTVWAWLIGPFIDAWLKVHPGENASARKFLERFPESMNENGIGTISEVFDAREPHTAGGCIAQAWSVAEVLRSWLKTA